ncbi:MAG: glycosyl hydrolase [Bacteroidetes bacterium]|nr:glycosyl hydrolase [Bacteroidota bacterium]
MNYRSLQKTGKQLFSMGLAVLFLFGSTSMMAQKKKSEKAEENDTIKSGAVSGLKFRSIGPAFTSGRIADFAVNPKNHSEYYVAAASGHVWKTENNGTTFKPIFDNHGAYSMGCLAMDPNNSNVIWVGTGENNHQRALGYGDGVYKSIDGGKSFKNMGLKESRQIGMIAIDPRNSNVVYVAAEGSVWGPGGDRGLYKTTDGGENWEKVLDISENTGVNNVLLHPCNPDILFVTSEQRRRHVFTKIGGGPESAVYKSTDAGKTFRKIEKGLPGVHKGGMGIAISPVDPNVWYIIIEAAEDKGGFYRSTDMGESWSKMSDHSSSGQYYNEIYCDPVDVDKVYSMETVSRVTLDGGKTWKSVGNNDRHVDDHAIWIDPSDTKHFMIGGDGGVYETFDAGANWLHKTNLPVTQFYRVAVDNTEPFYWVYGGTQDNSSFGGPSQNTHYDGVSSCEWVTTLGGDGFFQAIEPTNPDIVYSAYQYGNIYRFDKKSGESINIKPQPRKDEDTYKWNWNTPFILSPHSPTRLYMAANKVFRSDDRGNTWQVISDDITAQIDRNTWPVMDHYWSIDAVAKDVSTSLYGMGVSLEESPLKEGLLYVGADDGVIQVTEDAGGSWTKYQNFPGVPEYTYVSDILASKHDENVVFASFNNLKRDDFKPYILKSTDKGKSWTSIAANLPDNGSVHTIQQDHVNPDLLFVGTEFAAYFSADGGKIWTKLSSGLPTVAIMDMAIQERENDLVLASFGRGFYIMDDYTPLRTAAQVLKDSVPHMFPIKDALLYAQTSRGGYGSGSNVYIAKNPDFGATFTYYIKEAPKTLKQMRQKEEKKLFKDKKPIPMPTLEELRAEENEVKPHMIFTITDADGNIIRKLSEGVKSGINRTTWDLRYASTRPVNNRDGKYDPTSMGGSGLMVMPGPYFVSVSQVVRGEVTELITQQPFNVIPLENTTLPASNREELVAFQNEAAELARVMMGTEDFTEDLLEQVRTMKQAAQRSMNSTPELIAQIEAVEARLDDVLWEYNGQQPKASREENWPQPVPLNDRLRTVAYTHWRSTSDITQTQRDAFDILKVEFPPVLEEVKSIYEKDIPAIAEELKAIKAPWTPGVVPEWNFE